MVILILMFIKMVHNYEFLMMVHDGYQIMFIFPPFLHKEIEETSLAWPSSSGRMASSTGGPMLLAPWRLSDDVKPVVANFKNNQKHIKHIQKHIYLTKNGVDMKQIDANRIATWTRLVGSCSWMLLISRVHLQMGNHHTSHNKSQV